MIQIIPAIDIIDGKCVRLSQGNYSSMKVYNEDPAEVARQFEEAGISRLHLVDLDGARAGQVRNWKTLEQIATCTSLIIDFGGGIASFNDVSAAFNAGATLISVGSIAVKDKIEFINWLSHYGSSRFLLGADVKQEAVVIKGWTEVSELSVFDLIEDYQPYGLKNIFCTDVSKDGMLKGPSIPLYKKIIHRFSDINLIASGGVASIKDIDDLQDAGCKSVIIGKAIYEQKIKLSELRKYAN